MTTLLEFFLKYLDFLYLDPHFRITDSSTSGVANNGASLTLTSPLTTWQISNDRGQVLIGIVPTKLAAQPQNWFRLSIIRSIIRRYLDDYDETNVVSPIEAVTWVRDNRDRIDDLFPILWPPSLAQL